MYLREAARRVSNTPNGIASSEDAYRIEQGSTPIRILIADDHPTFRDELKQILSKETDFLVVAEAAAGEQVMKALVETEPDIILLDVVMPGMDGLTTLQKIHTAGSSAKVIVLVTSEKRADFVEVMKFGASGIVMKQSPTNLLLKSIRKVYAGEIWLDSHTTAAVMRRFASAEGTGVRVTRRDRDRSSLSAREQEIVALVAQGFKNIEVAEKMFISQQTVKNQLRNIFNKLGVSDRLELALYVFARTREGL